MKAKLEWPTRGALGWPSLIAAVSGYLCIVALAGPTTPRAPENPARADQSPAGEADE